jgi:hypothetical protein
MLTGVLAEHVRAVNAFDTDAVVATFAEDAFINEKDPEPPRKAPNLSPEPRPNASPCSLTTRPSCIAAWCRIRELAAATAKASSIPLSARFRLTPSGVRHCDPVRWLA